MRILKTIAFAVLLFATACSLGARQIDPTKPPPPPPADAPADTPSATPASAHAAPIDPTKPPPPPSADAPSAPPASDHPAPIDPLTPPPPPPAEAPVAAAAVFDPLHAGRSVDVGTFYMKRGNLDAAIDRFQEAARYEPKLAKPWLLLGEAYEKKHDDAHALEAYRKYLELYPDAGDAARIQKRIAELEEKIGPQASKATP